MCVACFSPRVSRRRGVYPGGLSRGGGWGGRLSPGLAEEVQGQRGAVALGSVVHAAGGGSSLGCRLTLVRVRGGGCGPCQAIAVPPPPIGPPYRSSAVPLVWRAGDRGVAPQVLCTRVRYRGVREDGGLWVR